MFRIFLAVLAAVVLLLAVGAILLGAFPPNPKPNTIEKTVPNDRFQSR
jgi:hypothetical protein